VADRWVVLGWMGTPFRYCILGINRVGAIAVEWGQVGSSVGGVGGARLACQRMVDRQWVQVSSSVGGDETYSVWFKRNTFQKKLV